ncbi:carbohydrate porin [Hankyongella ginsenosidimutans]|uniref:Carbohydrate porin n=1 Tax=Hankyongella ginsenosidimutans TaxID=1763828 RepID=A0A4D7C7Q5_9SPHN|nr:carbohydrate porin [Hankyongella ginsenosidimutans]
MLALHRAVRSGAGQRPDGVSVARRGNDGGYIRAESRLMSEGNSEDQGLTGFVRLGWADPRFNDFGSFYAGGLVYTGAIPGRNEDQLGLAIAPTPARPVAPSPWRRWTVPASRRTRPISS